MGKMDNVTKKYVSRNDIFADIVNYYLFQGKQRVQPDDLRERDVTELISAYKQISDVVSKQKLRDVLKSCTFMSAGGYEIVVIGIENQADIHYAMPVKNLIYDAINYASQADAISSKHKKEKDLKGDEFLSHFSKEDKLLPVITITVYFGNKDWDGPRSLHEMFGEGDVGILQYVDDYRLNLISPKEIDDFGSFHTQFGKVMEFIAVSGNKEKMRNLLASDDSYRNIEPDAYQIMKQVTNLEIKIPVNAETGGVDMCEAWKAYGNECLVEGEVRGEARGEKKKGIQVYINMIRRGFDPETAQAVADISDDLVLEAEKQIAKD